MLVAGTGRGMLRARDDSGIVVTPPPVTCAAAALRLGWREASCLGHTGSIRYRFSATILSRRRHGSTYGNSDTAAGCVFLVVVDGAEFFDSVER